ncbi:MAG: amidohydrolase family protein [Niabella sp.]
MNIIDTHIHIWDLNQSTYEWLKTAPPSLNRTYDFNELELQMDDVGIVAGILVQADNTLSDTDLMLATARKYKKIKGVVGWLPLMNPTETERLLEERFLKEKYFVGVRHLIHDEADPAWLLQPAVIESLKILSSCQIPFDVVGVLPEHIITVLKVAEEIPQLTMVFDHINQPPIASGEKFGQWGSLMQQAAAHKNFYVKISGLGVTAGKRNFTVNNITPYIQFALEQFGVNRCFMGGDWPVSLLADGYCNTWRLYQNVLSSLLHETEQQKLYYSNAVSFYNLEMN